jgi:glycosyltransferase involved in cell wall biosynthesis
MRILALSNLYPNPWQPGRAPYNRLIFRTLAAQHPLHVIAPVAWTDYAALRLFNRGLTPPARVPLPQSPTWDGIPVEYPLYLFPPRVLRGWYGHCFRESIRDAFTRAVDKFSPDLVYASWAYPDGWAAVELAHQFGLPVVVSVLGSDVLGVPAGSAKHRRTLDGLRRADAVITVSLDLASKIIPFDVAPERVRVICTGVDPSLFHWEPQAAARQRLGLGSEPLILAVGNLVPVKGFDVFLSACFLLAKTGTPFRCVVVGQGPLRAEL